MKGIKGGWRGKKGSAADKMRRSGRREMKRRESGTEGDQGGSVGDGGWRLGGSLTKQDESVMKQQKAA